jgi:hypothetical protein
MRLDFNVLWVEDQPRYVQSHVPAIERHMGENGFALNVTHCQTMAEVESKIAPDVFDDEFDLVLVDWDLGSSPGGEELRGDSVIQAIREKIPYKDIIFYSGQAGIADLRKYAYEAQVEGIFFTGRADGGIVQAVKDVFDSLVKKVLDLDHTRGIVMGATSDIDFMVNECLKHAHGKLEPEKQKSMVADAIKHIDRRMADLAKQVDQLRKATALEPLFDAHGIFQSYDRLHMLSDVLKLDVFAAHKGYTKSVTGYMGNVVPHRNVFAHVLATPGGPKQLVNNKGEIIDLNKAREIRRTIVELRGDFRSLLEALQPPPKA